MKAMRLAGITLDLYDDNGADLNLETVKAAGFSPERVEVLSHTELDALPDRLFAMVGTNDGDVVRKYAMHDAPHAVMSMQYFLDHRRSLPEQLWPKIAGNLVNACAWYDLEPPEELVKIALLGAALTALDVSNTVGTERTRHKADMANFRAAQASGAKIADLQGTTAMSLSGPSKKPTMPTLSLHKTAGWQHCGELAAMEVRAEEKIAENTHYAFPHSQRYPITTVEQVKSASAFFADYANDMPPLERRIFAHSVHLRAEELGVKVAGKIEKYAGNDYGPHFEGEMAKRMTVFENTPVGPQYREFYEKRAAIEPDVMASSLTLLDQAAFARGGHGNFRDAYAAVYEDSTKQAGIGNSPEFEMIRTEDSVVSTDDLQRLAQRYTKLDALFGDGFGLKFMADPKKIYLGLPPGQKRILARLARATT